MAADRHACIECFNYGDDSDVPGYSAPICKQRPRIENLRSFPFKSTACAQFLEHPDYDAMHADLKATTVPAPRSDES